MSHNFGFTQPPGGSLPYPPTPGYPQASSTPGYPPAYPPSSTPAYPPSSTPAYPPSSTPAYPPAPGYPSTPSYPPAPGYPPANPGYPPANPGYPPANPGYPPTNPSYPPTNPGYPPAGSGYPAPSAPAPEYAAAACSAGQLNSSAPGYPPSTGPYPNLGGLPPATYPAAPAYSAVPAYSAASTYQAAPLHQSGTSFYGAPAHHAMNEPTIRYLGNFDPSTDASMLRRAMKGLGTDEASIINILANRTNDQRQRILASYQQAFGKDLIKDLKSELSGDFERVVLAMMTPTCVLLADHLCNAMRGLGTNEDTLIEILCTRTNREIYDIKMAYQSKYGRPLQRDLEGDTSGHFRRLLVSMSTAARDEANTNLQLAPQLAQQLYRAGEGRLGTDEAEFNRILSTYSYPVLRAVFQEYKKIKGKSLHDAIKSEFSGDIRSGLLAVVMSIENTPQFFAHCLHNCMRGLGTKDDSLIRIIVTRAEIDLGNIKREYQRMYGRTLEADIKGDTSGDYRKMLLAIAQG